MTASNNSLPSPTSLILSSPPLPMSQEELRRLHLELQSLAPDLKRVLAKRKLDWFARLNGFEPARHHRLLNSKLEAVAAGTLKRLMIFMPPGHAKSTYASHLFPAWYMGKFPERNVIGASNTADNAHRFGRRVRNLLRMPEWPFEAMLSEDSQAQGDFATKDGGEYFAVGVDGTVTSRRADLIIIDDPIKGVEDAESPLKREKLKDWYNSDLYTRRSNDDTAIIIIQTRWHEDDMSGWLQEEMKTGGDQWEVLCLPALAEEGDPLGRQVGEALWPERYSAAGLEQVRRQMGSRQFLALFQQRPTAEEGDYFKREWFRFYDTHPADLTYYGASDYATKDGAGDWTVHGAIGLDTKDNIYIIDIWRKQTTTDQWVEAFIDMVEVWEPAVWAEEDGQILKSVGPYLKKRMEERHAHCYRVQYPSLTNKRARARAIQARMAEGKVFFPRHAPWVGDLISELLAFDSGKHDDQVDVLSLIGRMLADMYAKRKEVAPRPAAPKPMAEVTLQDIIDEDEGPADGRKLL